MFPMPDIVSEKRSGWCRSGIYTGSQFDKLSDGRFDSRFNDKLGMPDAMVEEPKYIRLGLVSVELVM